MMEKQGWKYSKQRPTEYLKDADIDQLKASPLYDYNTFRQDDHKAQWCLVKE